MLYYLFYTSLPTKEITKESLEAITAKSIPNNKDEEITGILLGLENRFMQYLEGRQTDVEKLFDSIKKDDRHHEVILWISGQTENRIFKDWSMGSWMLKQNEIKNLSALKDIESFLKNPTNDSAQSKRFIGMMNNLLDSWIHYGPGEFE